MAQDSGEIDISPNGYFGRTAEVRRGIMKKEYDFSKGKRGPIVKPARGKTRVTIRLDNQVLDWFRNQAEEAGGGNYQSAINDALREYIVSQGEQLESTIRRVLREELRRTG